MLELRDATKTSVLMALCRCSWPSNAETGTGRIRRLYWLRFNGGFSRALVANGMSSYRPLPTSDDDEVFAVRSHHGRGTVYVSELWTRPVSRI